MSNIRKRRPQVDDYESFEEFYSAVKEYIEIRSEQAQFDPTVHIDRGNMLVRECPHCGAPSIVSIMSPAHDPSWRCVGESEIADRHQFTLENVPSDRKVEIDQSELAGEEQEEPQTASD